MDAIQFQFDRAFKLKIPIQLYMHMDGHYTARISKHKEYKVSDNRAATAIKLVIDNYLKDSVGIKTL